MHYGRVLCLGSIELKILTQKQVFIVSQSLSTIINGPQTKAQPNLLLEYINELVLLYIYNYIST